MLPEILNTCLSETDMDAGIHRYFDTSSDEFDGASITELLIQGQI